MAGGAQLAYQIFASAIRIPCVDGIAPVIADKDIKIFPS
jgi:hypothetical protein